MLYMGRLANLIAYTLMASAAVRYLPFTNGHWPWWP